MSVADAQAEDASRSVEALSLIPALGRGRQENRHSSHRPGSPRAACAVPSAVATAPPGHSGRARTRKLVALCPIPSGDAGGQRLDDSPGAPSESARPGAQRSGR